MSVSLPESIRIAQLPTPVHALQRWNAHTGKTRIYLKRDDLTGVLLSGNKVRKLEFVVKDALNQKADVLITCGGLQSNHARTTASLAARLGLQCHLVLKGTPAGTPTGNYFLDTVLGANMTFITAEQYASANMEIMTEIAEAYRGKGSRAYVIAEGASCALGAFGYAKAIEEIKKQSIDLNVNFDAIICATGSGGTQAGLILGTKLYNYPVPIYGINICDDADYFTKKINDILSSVRGEFLPNFAFTDDDIRIIDGYVGEGYGKARPEELQLLQAFARTEGIALEPVYTGKALYGLMEELKHGRFARMKNILFIHTGGIFGLFPYANQFA
ncbi:D-cysteine desulfhydrase family protein [candidate division KSB1 bacterium]|nr:D-cysteine desulfhydrase family protein [candidate division KSB1 bacterium]